MLAALILPILGTIFACQVQPPQPPNLLVLILDDVGIDQLAIYDRQNAWSDPLGYPYAHTPTLDGLAAQGVRFTQARGCPVCSASRAAILTGAYPFRNAIGASPRAQNNSGTGGELAKHPSPILYPLPVWLKATGYRDVGAFGKWHMGSERSDGGTMDDHPTDLGFDVWQGTPRNLDSKPWPPFDPNFTRGYFSYWWAESAQRVHVAGEDAVERTFSAAAAWIATAKEPWAVYLAPNAAHSPLDAENWPTSGHGFGAGPPHPEGTNTVYRARLEHVDTQLAVLLAGFPDLLNETTVIVVGENGTDADVLSAQAGEVRYPQTHPLWTVGDGTTPPTFGPYDLSHFKKTAFEGGVRIPMIVTTPGGMQGETFGGLVDLVDLWATVADLHTLPSPPWAGVDSRSFAGAIRQEFPVPGRVWALSQFFRPNGVDPAQRFKVESSYIREAMGMRWKLVHRTGDVFFFYNLTADPLETLNLGMSHPEFPQTHADYLALTGG